MKNNTKTSNNNLKCLLHNTQDLFLFMDKYKDEVLSELTEPKWQMLSTSLLPNKNLQKLLSLSETYKNFDPDILLLVEVGGLESLDNFNKHFLEDKYQVFYSASNSDRGIDLGFLVKKEISHHYSYQAYVDNLLVNRNKFSRGVFELSFKVDHKTKVIFLLTHLKSKLNLKKLDFEGRGQRMAEVLELASIYQKQKHRHKEAAVFICGDLNGLYSSDAPEEEFRPFTDLKLMDALEFKKAPFEEKISYIYFDKGGNTRPMQLDYVLGAKSDLEHLDLQYTEIINFRYQNQYLLAPTKLSQKDKLPSDHYPYFFQVKL